MIGTIIPDDKILVGSIRTSAQLVGRIQSDVILRGSVFKPSSYEDYLGDYSVTPKTIQQTLSTIDRHMTSDVVIQAIPYYEVSNNSGGTTATIGDSEV